jgi:hypothetical protein
VLTYDIVAQLRICEADIVLRLLRVQLLIVHGKLLLLREILLQLLSLDLLYQLLLIRRLFRFVQVLAVQDIALCYLRHACRHYLDRLVINLEYALLS